MSDALVALECNVCYDSINVSKCSSCTFTSCKSCINKWKTDKMESECPACKKQNTFKKTKRVFYTSDVYANKRYEKDDFIFHFMDDFSKRYGSRGSIKLK